MSHRDVHLHLDAYLGVRQALGFQMRAERTLLRDFVRSLETDADAGPIRAYLAVDWACASSAQRGASGAAQRLSMARSFLMYLRTILPETEVPDSGLVRAFRRPKPYLFTASQITALIHAAQDFGPPQAPSVPIPSPPSSVCWPVQGSGWVRRSASRCRTCTWMPRRRSCTLARPNSTNHGWSRSIPPLSYHSATTPLCGPPCTTRRCRTSSLSLSKAMR